MLNKKKSYAGSTTESYEIREPRAFGRKKKNPWYQ